MTNSSLEQADRGMAVRLINALLATWRIPVIVGLVLFVLMLTVSVLLRVGVPVSTTYLTRFQLTFPGVATSHYPNGTPFSLQEIIAPEILSKVYARLKLNEFGIKKEDYYEGFSIRPFATIETEIVERYRQQLSDRRLTYTERERLELLLRNQLNELAKSSAELSFTARGHLFSSPLPREIGRVAVQMILQTWSQDARERRGVLRSSGFSATEIIIPADEIAKKPFAIAYIGLFEANRRLGRRLKEFSEAQVIKFQLPIHRSNDFVASTIARNPNFGVSSARDPKSGKSLSDVERDFRILQLFQLDQISGLVDQYDLDGRDQALSIVRSRMRDIQIEQTNTENNTAAITDSISHFVQSMAGLRGTPLAASQSESSGNVAGAVQIPQINADIVNKIIELSRRGDDIPQQDYLTYLINLHLDLRERANSLVAERTSWSELATALGSSAVRQPFDDAARSRMLGMIGASANEINAQWATLNRLLESLTPSRDAELFSHFATERDVITNYPIAESHVIVIPLAFAILFAFVFWVIRAFVLLGRRSAP